MISEESRNVGRRLIRFLDALRPLDIPLLWQSERVDVAVYRGCVYASAGNRDWCLVRAAQDQRSEWLASVGARGRVREYVTLRVDEVKRADIDDAVRDRRREQRDARRRGRPEWVAHRLSAARYGVGDKLSG